MPSPSRASPLDYLHSAGNRAGHIVTLTWGTLTISLAVIVVISLLVLAGIWRRSPSPIASNERVQVSHPKGGEAWIWIGVSASTLALLFTVVWTMVVLAQTAAPAKQPALTIEVTGHQWWWQIRYLSSDPAQVFSTANELHIPVREPVKVVLVGGDVIHSFWIPALAGKTDVIPGQTNETWLQASQPGVYRGTCAEYCGIQHAKMGLLAVAQSPSDFTGWRNHQLQSPASPTNGQQWAGLAQFTMHCGGCHAVRGTDAAGALGPDLSHLAQRRTLAAALLPNDAAHLTAWVSDPQSPKPGNLMQKPELSRNELADIRAYLETLN
jgi:cytochrome c oxidase subunit 2